MAKIVASTRVKSSYKKASVLRSASLSRFRSSVKSRPVRRSCTRIFCMHAMMMFVQSIPRILVSRSRAHILGGLQIANKGTKVSKKLSLSRRTCQGRTLKRTLNAWIRRRAHFTACTLIFISRLTAPSSMLSWYVRVRLWAGARQGLGRHSCILESGKKACEWRQ